jgi:hypothetical protein
LFCEVKEQRIYFLGKQPSSSTQTASMQQTQLPVRGKSATRYCFGRGCWVGSRCGPCSADEMIPISTRTSPVKGLGFHMMPDFTIRSGDGLYMPEVASLIQISLSFSFFTVTVTGIVNLFPRASIELQDVVVLLNCSPRHIGKLSQCSARSQQRLQSSKLPLTMDARWQWLGRCLHQGSGVREPADVAGEGQPYDWCGMGG